jgi:penicillin-binding protein 1B
MADKKRKTAPKRKPVLKEPSRLKRFFVAVLWLAYDIGYYGLLLVIIASSIYALSVSEELKEKFEGSRWRIAGHVFSDSLTLLPGQNIEKVGLIDRLMRLNYQQSDGSTLRQGEFRIGETSIEIHTRDFEYPREKSEGFLLRLGLRKNRITSMHNMAQSDPIALAELEPLLIGRFIGTDREERDLVTYDEVSPYLINAIVAIEDNAYFTHHGINWKGVARMILVNLRSMKLVQGGSSITQQLVKNFYLTHEKSVRRKVKEAIMAVALEMLYTKEEIFEAYLNEVYFGHSGSVSVCGVGEASKFYFGKNVRNIDLAESALLAGLIRSPEGYNPRKRAERAKTRRDYILTRMQAEGLITKDQAKAASLERVKVNRHTPSYTIAPYFVDFLKTQLSEKYSSEVLVSQGLKVFTTLDPGMQKRAEAALSRGLADLEKRFPRLAEDPKNPLQASLIVIEPQTGYIRAMVGGRSYAASQYNRAAWSKRQPGSVFKPFVYATGFVMADEGKIEFRPTDMLENSPLKVDLDSGKTWSPQNYSKTFGDPVTVRRALEKSMNVPTVRAELKIGVNNVIKTARKMGLTSNLPAVPSLALGSADLTLLETASAYSTLAAMGSHAEPISVRDVVDQTEQVLSKKTLRVKKAISARAAYQTVSLMKGVMDRGTAARSRAAGFSAPAAGKTGTTNAYRDAWFVGFTPDLLCAVWVGFDSGKNLRLSGGSAALPIWLNFMKAQIDNYNAPDWEVPPGIVIKKVDYETGLLQVYGCPKVIDEAFLEGQEQTEECETHRNSLIEYFKKNLGSSEE